MKYITLDNIAQHSASYVNGLNIDYLIEKMEEEICMDYALKKTHLNFELIQNGKGMVILGSGLSFNVAPSSLVADRLVQVFRERGFRSEKYTRQSYSNTDPEHFDRDHGGFDVRVWFFKPEEKK